MRTLAVDVDVHERTHLAGLVADEAGDGKGMQRVGESGGVDLELLPAPRLRREKQTLARSL